MAPVPALRRLDASRREDFLALMRRGSEESAACLCTAYLGAGPEPAGAGSACRESRFREGLSDGYLLYDGAQAVAWCQVGPWASFPLLAKRPPPAPDAWALTCLVVAPEARRRGHAHALLREVLAEIARCGAPYAVAFGHRLGPTYSSPLPELPESVCRGAGMTLLRDDPECPLYGIRLGAPGR
ncbi:MAG: GNAT family N-acetyltransferase [Planctomycetales bacterium]|nr:GNAT family N-acetyltransferase [Planctomycetales bacterium]